MEIQIILLALFAILPNSLTEDFNGDSELMDRRVVFNMYPNCLLHEDCKKDEYCYTRKKQTIGLCTKKERHFEACTSDEQCESDHCHWSRCKGMPAFRNLKKGRQCQKDVDCHSEQRCDRKKCVDKTISGWCSSDSDCMSNYCKMFKCKAPKTETN